MLQLEPQLPQMPHRKSNDHSCWLGNQVYLLVIFKLIKDIRANFSISIEKCSSTWNLRIFILSVLSNVLPGCQLKQASLVSTYPDLHNKTTNITSCYLTCLRSGDTRSFTNSQRVICYESVFGNLTILSLRKASKQTCPLADHSANSVVVQQESLRSYINSVIVRYKIIKLSSC